MLDIANPALVSIQFTSTLPVDEVPYRTETVRRYRAQIFFRLFHDELEFAVVSVTQKCFMTAGQARHLRDFAWRNWKKAHGTVQMSIVLFSLILVRYQVRKFNFPYRNIPRFKNRKLFVHPPGTLNIAYAVTNRSFCYSTFSAPSLVNPWDILYHDQIQGHP